MAETELSKLLELYGDLPEFVEVPALDVKTIGNFGNTPLHVAAARGVLAEVQVLIAQACGRAGLGELFEQYTKSQPE